MVEQTIGASDVMNAGEQPEPTRADAFARRNELVHDEAFKERLGRGDPGAIEEIRKLNNTIKAVDFVNVGSEEQIKASEMLDREQRIETFSKQADLPPGVVEQIRSGAAVTRQEYRMAEAERKRMLADSDFRKSYFEGNRASRTRMALVSIILGSSIKD